MSLQMGMGGFGMEPSPQPMPAEARAESPFMPSQHDILRGASSRVQKMVVKSIHAGPMQDSAPPNKKRKAAIPAKLRAVQVSMSRAPQTMTMMDTNLPMGSFCSNTVTG